MTRLLQILFVYLFATAGAYAENAGRVAFKTDFDRLDWCSFHPVQTDLDRIDIGSETIDGNTVNFVSIRADGGLLNTKNGWDRPPGLCTEETRARAEAIEGGDLLESDAAVPDFSDLGQFANCPVADSQKQRNEIRLDERWNHPAQNGHWYALSFRLDGSVPTCGSTRQVIAQWKFTYDLPVDDVDFSPDLALRVDNGVLHATIQSDDCRCIIAKSEGDPDLTVEPGVQPETAAVEATPALVPVAPICDNQCTPDPNFLLEAYSPDGTETFPSLPDPRADWVQIHAFVEAHGTPFHEPTTGRIELYVGGQPIARVTNGFGYKLGRIKDLRFKFGQYRNKIAARTRALYDSFCLNSDHKDCDLNQTIAELIGE